MTSTLWTVGHSTRPLDEFLRSLAGHSIGLVADVRRFPGSKRYPHFNREEFEDALRQNGVAYRHYPDLGGRRGKRAADSPNNAWRVESFNAYADYMATPEFNLAIDDLARRAEETPTAIMCSEAVPWRCHRRLIADAFVVRGWSVLDIMAPGRADPHGLTSFARVEGDSITYPAEPLFPAGPE